MQSKQEEKREIEALQKRMEMLEARLMLIENYLGISSGDHRSDIHARAGQPDGVPGIEDSSELEMRVGAVGLTWIGGFMILCGIILMISYVYRLGLTYVAILFGYLLSAAVLFFRKALQRTVPSLYQILETSADLIFFYATLRLHFFTDEPLIQSRAVAIALLAVVAAAQFYYALQRKSEFFVFLAILQGYIAISISDVPLMYLSFAVLMAATSLMLLLRNGWQRLFIGVILVTYFMHFTWLLNNPLAGNPAQAAPQHNNNMLFLLMYTLLFGLPVFWQAKKGLKQGLLAASTLLAGFGFSLLCTVNVLTYFQPSWGVVSLTVSAFFLALASAQYGLTRQKLVASLNACFGFIALSIAIAGLSHLPHSYAWLAWQSLVVLMYALWLRSRILTFLNAFIFVLIWMVYWGTHKQVTFVNVSLVLVTFASAHILHYQKHVLGLRSEALENLYLVIGFLWLPMTLYVGLPLHFVTLSWIGVSAAYFAFSLIFHIVKYRWMCILNLIITLFYLIFVDFGQLQGIYRILAFLFLGLLALLLSIFYTKRREDMFDTRD
ncbi:MAG: hypothetical protein Q9P90_06915 [candidate division KSB1 bacterium]|nr:hypothetical protein [candidate division KSB1 bacterium]